MKVSFISNSAYKYNPAHIKRNSIRNFSGFTLNEQERLPANSYPTGYRIEEKDYTEDEEWYHRSRWKEPIRVYIASPNETITEEIKRKHTHIQTNNLLLSQIRNDYKNGYNNFGKNGYKEIEHFEGLRDHCQKIVEKNTKEIEDTKQKLSQAKKNPLAPGLMKKLEYKYTTRIDMLENEIVHCNEVINDCNQKLPISYKRFEVLKGIDDTVGEIAKLDEKIYSYTHDEHSHGSISYYWHNEASKKMNELTNKFEIAGKKLENIKKIEDFSGKEKAMKKLQDEIERLKEEISQTKKELEKWENVMKEEDAQRYILETQDKVRLFQKLDEAYNKTEQFYREYYPEWCDI